MLLKTVVIFGLVYSASASICCFPRQYEAYQGVMQSSLKHGRFSTTFGTLRMVYDGTNKKAFFDENLIVDGTPVRIQVIQDFPAKRKYTLTGATCKSEVMNTFVDGCVPDSGNLLITAFFGDQSMDMDVYNMTTSSGANFMLVERDNCVPIMNVSSRGGSEPSTQLVVFMNVTTSIKDTSVFNIPSSCQGPSPVGK